MAGIGTRKLRLEIDGTEHTAEVSVAKVTSGESDSDFVTFAEAALGGGRDYKFVATLVQDAATGSLYDLLWSAVGTDVDCVLMPYGNEAPSVAEPHYGFTATVVEPDGDLLGGEADKSTSARMTVEVEWPMPSGKPTKITV